MSRHATDIKGRVAANIAQAIEDSGLSVAEIARRMDGNERAVRRWRDGDVTPGQDNLARLASVIGRDDLTWFYMPHERQAA